MGKGFLEKLYKDSVAVVKKGYDDTVDTAMDASGRTKKIEDNKKKLKGIQDGVNLDKFNEQDLLNVDQDLYAPKFFDPKKQKEQDAMLSLFNARKDQVLAQRAMPGISQTRF